MKYFFKIYIPTFVIILSTFVVAPTAHADSLKVFKNFDSVEFGGPGHIDLEFTKSTNLLTYLGIKVKPGQKLDVHIQGIPGRTQDAQLSYFSITVLNYQRQAINSYQVHSFREPYAGDIFVAPGNTLNQGDRYFILVDIPDDYAYENFSLDLNLDDVSDSNSGTDAPDTFEHALPLTDDLHGFLPVSNTYSTDKADMYTLDIPKNSTLSLEATPEDQGMLGIEIFNDNKKSISTYNPHNPGEINKLKVTAKNSHKLYIKATGQAGKYTIRHTISSATGEELKTAFDLVSTNNNYYTNNNSVPNKSYTLYYVIGLLVLAGLFLKYKAIIIPFIEKFLDHN